MKLHEHVMFDLETLATTPDASILSIAAVPIDPFVRVTDGYFYARIKASASPIADFRIDQNTIDWWNKQSEEARQEAFSGTTLLLAALHDLTAYLSKFGPNVKVWGKGASFDAPILEHAYAVYGMQAPWKYYNSLCYRTLIALPRVPKEPHFEGMKHSALADAMHQARYAQMILEFLAQRV